MDADSDEVFKIAEEERSFLDQAFFILIFGALEKQIGLLASARLHAADRRDAMRDAAFEKRLGTAVKVAIEVLERVRAASIESVQAKIAEWYELRNQIAHGEAPTDLVDVVAVLEQAKTMSELFAEVRIKIATG